MGRRLGGGGAVWARLTHPPCARSLALQSIHPSARTASAPAAGTTPRSSTPSPAPYVPCNTTCSPVSSRSPCEPARPPCRHVTLPLPTPTPTVSRRALRLVDAPGSAAEMRADALHHQPARPAEPGPEGRPPPEPGAEPPRPRPQGQAHPRPRPAGPSCAPRPRPQGEPPPPRPSPGPSTPAPPAGPSRPASRQDTCHGVLGPLGGFSKSGHRCGTWTVWGLWASGPWAPPGVAGSAALGLWAALARWSGSCLGAPTRPLKGSPPCPAARRHEE